MIDAVFIAFDVILDVKTERRENFDVTTECETISAQNIDFFDVATDEIDEVEKSEIFEVVFDEIANDVSIKIDSLVDEDVADDVSTICDVKEIVEIAIIANIVFDVDFADSLDVMILTFDARRSLTINTQEHVDKYSQCFR